MRTNSRVSRGHLSSIRTRNEGDIAGCVVTLADVHREDHYPLEWPADPRAWLSPEGLLAAWVAEDDGEVLGHVALCTADPGEIADRWCAALGRDVSALAEIARLFVSPQARGKSLGAALLSRASAEARQRRQHPVLEVVGSDRAAIALYERQGWRLVGSLQVPWSTPREEAPLLHAFVAPDI